MKSSHDGRQESKERKQQVTNVDFIFKSRYRNTLPDLPADPKFLECPFIPLSRFVEYRHTTLEKNYKYELLTEDASMAKIDLIDPMAYYFNPHEKIQMDQKDERLLEDESLSREQNLKRSQQHSKVVPWMRKTEYIGTEFSRFGTDRGADPLRSGGIKNRPKDEDSYRERDSQVAAINRTFDETKRPTKQHYSKKGVHAVDEMPILPDFELWPMNWTQVVFDIDPLPYNNEEVRKEKLRRAVIRGMMDSEGRHFVGYFAPDEEALRKMGESEGLEEIEGEMSHDYPLEREYNWSMKKKGPDQPESSYFLTLRQGAANYNEIGQSVRLTRREKKHRANKNSILRIIFGEPDEKERENMNVRRNQLLHPSEIQEEDGGAVDAVVEEGTSGLQPAELNPLGPPSDADALLAATSKTPVDNSKKTDEAESSSSSSSGESPRREGGVLARSPSESTSDSDVG